MKELQMLAIATTLLMGVLLVYCWWDIWKRSPFPELRHGRAHMSGGSMKWLWAVGLFVAFAAGGPELRSRTVMNGAESDIWNSATMGASGYEQVSRISHQSGWEIRLAAYRYALNEVEWQSGERFRTERVAWHLPLWLPLALVAYWMVVVRARATAQVIATGREHRPHSV